MGLAPLARRWRANWDLGALAVIVVVGAALRLAWIENATFGFDEARLSVIALEMARGGAFASVGMQSSVGLPNPPAAAWIMALIYRFSSDPLAASGCVALLNALAIAALGWLARRAWGRLAGLLAAALLALSPWAVLYSRSIWAQNLLAPLAVCWALAGAQAAQSRRGGWLAAHILLAGLAPQIHFAGLTLVLPTLWLVWRQRLWRQGWACAAGVAGAALAAFPYALALWPSRQHILDQIGRIGASAFRVDALAWKQLAQMVVGAEWQVIVTGDQTAWPLGLTLAQQTAVFVLGVGALVGLGLLLWDARRMPQAERCNIGGALRELTLVWALASPLLFIAHSTEVYHHYLLAILPSLYLAIAYGVSHMAAQRLRCVGLALALGAACVQGLLFVRTEMQITMDTGGGPGALRWPRAVAQAVDDGRPVVIAADCDWEVVCAQANVFQALLWGRSLQVIDSDNMLLIPAAAELTGAHLVITAAAQHALDALDRVGLAEAAWRDLYGASRSPYLRVPLRPDWRAHLRGWTPLEPLTLDNGAQIRAWHAEARGDGVRLWTLWRVVEPMRSGQYQQFNHLYVGERKVSGHDHSISQRAWRAGDWLITWADLDIPTEIQGDALYAEVGMYRWPEMTRAIIVERPIDGQTAIRLGPFARPTPQD